MTNIFLNNSEEEVVRPHYDWDSMSSSYTRSRSPSTVSQPDATRRTSLLSNSTQAQTLPTIPQSPQCQPGDPSPTPDNIELEEQSLTSVDRPPDDCHQKLPPPIEHPAPDNPFAHLNLQSAAVFVILILAHIWSFKILFSLFTWVVPFI